MKKRIIIVGDSFSLGVGADWPPFENVHPLAPPIGDTWIFNWKQTTTDYFKDIKLQQRHNIKENQSLLENLGTLQRVFRAWQDQVYKTDYFLLLKEENPNLTHEEAKLDPGLKHKRQSLESYPGTWSNVLGTLLPDIDVINLSSGGCSMATVVTSLSTFINANTDHDNYETLVFFQAPEPSRKHLITSDIASIIDKDQFTDFDLKLEHILDYNVATTNKIALLNEYYDFTGHNLAYVEKDLFVGEWFQNIYNMQQICKANHFNMAWCTATLPIKEVIENKDNMFPNVLELDVRYDRNPFTLDKFFASMTIFHRHLGMNHVDYGDIYSGCMHFSGEVQKHFAEYMAKSLIDNEEFWWQK